MYEHMPVCAPHRRAAHIHPEVPHACELAQSSEPPPEEGTIISTLPKKWSPDIENLNELPEHMQRAGGGAGI